MYYTPIVDGGEWYVVRFFLATQSAYSHTNLCHEAIRSFLSLPKMSDMFFDNIIPWQFGFDLDCQQSLFGIQPCLPTCSTPGFSGLNSDLVSTCSGTRGKPLFSVWKARRALRATGSSDCLKWPAKQTKQTLGEPHLAHSLLSLWFHVTPCYGDDGNENVT